MATAVPVVVAVAITVEVTVAVCAYAASIRKIDATVAAVMIRRSSERRRTRSEQ